MIRKLLIVFASGLVLSIVALGAAWVIGGQDLMTRIERDGRFAINYDYDDEDQRALPGATRTLPFDGARPLTVDFPVSLRFVRGDRAEMTVAGPARVIDALRWEDGRLSLGGASTHHAGIRVTIEAPQIVGLVLTAPGEVELRGLDQPSLRLDMRSPADIEASGRVGTLDVSTSGVGSIDLEDLEARDARAHISGVGSIDLNASGRVEANISGAGSVVLHRRPAVLTSHTSGIGAIEHDY